MNKQEYMNQLRKELNGLRQDDIDDIIRDQEEYFRDALGSGRSEDSVISSLGAPQSLAKELKAEYQIKAAHGETKVIAKTKSIFKAIIALCVLAPFNLIFILGPFVAICSTLFSFWTVVAVMGFIALMGLVIGGFFIFMLNPTIGLASVFGSVGVFGFTLLFFFVTYYMTSWFLKGTVSYLKWNMKLITQEA